MHLMYLIKRNIFSILSSFLLVSTKTSQAFIHDKDLIKILFLGLRNKELTNYTEWRNGTPTQRKSKAQSRSPWGCPQPGA